MGLVTLLIVVLLAVAVVVVLGFRLTSDTVVETGTSADRVAYQFAKDKKFSEGLLSHYSLRNRNTGFFGEWRETKAHGHRVAFQPGTPLSVMVGEFDPDEEQLTEVYLSKVSATRPMPDSPGRRLGPHVGEQGKDIAERFFLNASLPADHALRVAEVRKALLELSPAVLEVMIYETNGVQLDLDPAHATPATLKQDVARAAEIVDTLKRDDSDARYGK